LVGPLLCECEAGAARLEGVACACLGDAGMVARLRPSAMRSGPWLKRFELAKAVRPFQ